MSEQRNEDTGARPVDAITEAERTDNPTPDAATQGFKPFQAEVQEQEEGLFPPDIDPTIEIGGSPEEHQMIDEEFDPNA